MWGDIEKLFHLGIVEWRNRHFAENILAKYCEAKSEGKNMVATVGLLHSEGVAELLKEATKNRVEIKTIDIGASSRSEKSF